MEIPLRLISLQLEDYRILNKYYCGESKVYNNNTITGIMYNGFIYDLKYCSAFNSFSLVKKKKKKRKLKEANKRFMFTLV